MPKISNKGKSGLKITRALLNNKIRRPTLAESNSESDNDLIESAEFSHVPIKGLDISLDKMNMNHEDEINALELITQKLNAMMNTISRLDARQNEYDAALRNVTGVSPGSSSSSNATPSVVQQPLERADLDQLFRIPNPIKSLPVFEGNRKQLSAWLQTAENTLNLFNTCVIDMYVY